MDHHILRPSSTHDLALYYYLVLDFVLLLLHHLVYSLHCFSYVGNVVHFPLELEMG